MNSYRTKWNCDEFVRGAYCYRSTDGDKIPGDLTEILCKPVTVFDASGQEVNYIEFRHETNLTNHDS